MAPFSCEEVDHRHPTPLSAWMCRTGVGGPSISKECRKIYPHVKVPHPHIYEYANGKAKPTRDKAPLLSAALAQLGEKLEPPLPGLSIRELCYYDGLPDGARMDGNDAPPESEVGSEDDAKAAAA